MTDDLSRNESNGTLKMNQSQKEKLEKGGLSACWN